MYIIKMFKDGKWINLSKYKSFANGQRYLEIYRQQDKRTQKLYNCSPRPIKLVDYLGNLAEPSEQLDLFCEA